MLVGCLHEYIGGRKRDMSAVNARTALAGAKGNETLPALGSARAFASLLRIGALQAKTPRDVLR